MATLHLGWRRAGSRRAAVARARRRWRPALCGEREPQHQRRMRRNRAHQPPAPPGCAPWPSSWREAAALWVRAHAWRQSALSRTPVRIVATHRSTATTSSVGRRCTYANNSASASGSSVAPARRNAESSCMTVTSPGWAEERRERRECWVRVVRDRPVQGRDCETGLSSSSTRAVSGSRSAACRSDSCTASMCGSSTTRARSSASVRLLGAVTLNGPRGDCGKGLACACASAACCARAAASSRCVCSIRRREPLASNSSRIPGQCCTRNTLGLRGTLRTPTRAARMVLYSRVHSRLVRPVITRVRGDLHGSCGGRGLSTSILGVVCRCIVT